MTGLIRKSRVVFLSIAVLALAKTTRPQFHAGPPANYPNQNSEKVIVGAKAFDTEELVEQVWGKKFNPLKYGILPVLIVMQNNRSQSIDTKQLQVEIVGSDDRHVQASTPQELFANGTPKRRPSSTGQVPSPLPFPLPGPKNPMNNGYLEDDEFPKGFVPPGETVSGFVYFSAKSEPGDSIYLNGLREEPSGKELLYFEFGLHGQK